MQKSKKTVKSKSARVRRAAVATVLVLRTCNADLTSHNDFKWPQKGAVKAPDWRPAAQCGNGLHGLLWGEGEGGHLDYSSTAKWLVVEVPAKSIVDLKGKVKFPAGKVVYCGDRLGATSFIAAKRPGAAICGGTATAGDSGTATAGDSGTATAGVRGTATAGYGGTLQIKRYDPVADRYRIVTGHVGEEGIEANVPYKLDESGKLVRKVP